MAIIIGNFSIDIEEWVVASGINFAVDVIETASGTSISTSGTYFVHDGVSVPTTFSGITGGYRCYYNPASVYSDGTIDLTIHAENTASGVREQTFHMLYGYYCEFDELIDWGPNTEVITTIEATNLVICPNTEGDAFYFQTRDYQSHDLGAVINAVASVDLGATIYPQNTFFFYGRTFQITVSGVQDFSGNEMSPYIFSFTIENPQ